MAPSVRLRAYLALERAMVNLDAAGDPLGDELRDRMDPIWLMLSDTDRAELDHRTGDVAEFSGKLPRRDLAVRRDVRDYFRSAA